MKLVIIVLAFMKLVIIERFDYMEMKNLNLIILRSQSDLSLCLGVLTPRGAYALLAIVWIKKRIIAFP